MKLLLILFLIASTIALAEGHSSADYAALLPLHGNGADQGEWCRRGFEIARKELTKVGFTINLHYEDTGADAATAISAYRALRTRVDFPVAFTWGSGVGMALTPITNGDKVIQMGVATASPAYRSFGDYTFRVFPSADAEAQFISKVIKEKFSDAKLVALYVENDYGVGTFNALQTSLALRSLKLEFAQPYPIGTTDFRSLLSRIKVKDPSVIYLASYPNDGALLMKQARQLGIRSTFLSSVAIAGDKDFFQNAGGSAEGLLVTGTEYNSKHHFLRIMRILLDMLP